MTVKDKKGVSPLDLARGSRALLEIFSPKAQRPFPLAETTYVAMAEKPYTADADEYLAIQMERIKAEKMSVDPTEPECKVDEHEDLKNCEVVQSDIIADDGVSKLYFDTVMIKIDVKAQYYGMNGFYLI